MVAVVSVAPARAEEAMAQGAPAVTAAAPTIGASEAAAAQKTIQELTAKVAELKEKAKAMQAKETPQTIVVQTTIDPKDAAALKEVFTSLSSVLSQMQSTLKADQSPATKLAIAKSLGLIGERLGAISVTLGGGKAAQVAAGESMGRSGSAIAAGTPKALTEISAPSQTVESTLLPESSVATREASEESASAAAAFDIRNLPWPAILAVVAVAAIGVWLWRKDEGDSEVELAHTQTQAIPHIGSHTQVK